MNLGNRWAAREGGRSVIPDPQSPWVAYYPAKQCRIWLPTVTTLDGSGAFLEFQDSSPWQALDNANGSESSPDHADYDYETMVGPP